MWEAIVLTVAATSGNSIGKVLQKKGTVGLQPLALNLKVMRTYALSKTWVAGFCIDILGALLMLRAVSQAPVSVIQPVSGCGLAVLSIFSHFYLKEVMHPLDWIGIAMAATGTIDDLADYKVEDTKRYSLELSIFLCGVGNFGMKILLLGVGIMGEEQKVSAISFGHLAWLILSVVILFVGFASCVASSSQTSSSSSGIGTNRGGGGDNIWFGSRHLIWTRGLKHGRAIVVSTCAAVASIVTGVLVGTLALGEMLPVAPLSRMLLVIGWLLIIFGVVVLMSSHRLSLLVPQRFRRFMHPKSSMHKSLHPSRSGLRRWDSSPSTFVSMAPMHLHPQASPGKVKT